MNRGLKIFLLSGLTVYTLALMVAEVVISQDFVRHFFTDIEGTVPLYGINTTLSSFLLWSTALVFAVCIACLRDKNKEKREYYFFLSQLIVFAYLGLDDRFKFHDGSYLNILTGGAGDLSLIVVGMLEVYLLWRFGNLWQQKWKIRRPLIIAASLFCLMMLVDFFVPGDMVLRLSLEDLLKTWANVFFFFFAWTICMEKIKILKGSGSTNVYPLRVKPAKAEEKKIKMEEINI